MFESPDVKNTNAKEYYVNREDNQVQIMCISCDKDNEIYDKHNLRK